MGSPVNGEVAAQAGQLVRQDFSGREVENRGETAAAALAARAKAEVEARYLMALHRPRDIENFRARLLKECLRPGFADAAEYRRPVGGGKIATGPTIRLLESAIQHYGNIAADSPVTYETAEVRLVRAQMTDLETNTTWAQDIVIPKSIERRGDAEGNPPSGRVVISQRINSEKAVTFLVVATDDEIGVKQLALVSKAQRNNGQRLLPADIIAEALKAARATRATRDAEDPDASKRAAIDAFSSLNVTPADLAKFLGKTMDRLQPADLEELRGIYGAIKSGEYTWDAAMADKDAQRYDGGSAAAQKEELAKLLNLKKGQPKGEAETSTGETASKSPEAGAATEEDKAEPPQHVKDFQMYRIKIGSGVVWKILGNHGLTKDEELTAEVFAKMLPELEQALTDKRAADEAAQPKADSKLKFGNRGQK